MRILFDHGTPKGLARTLVGHSVELTKSRGWDTLTNGELLSAAEQAGFDILITTDKSLPHQQNLRSRRIAVIVLGVARWRLIKRMVPRILAALGDMRPGTYEVVDVPRE